MNKKAEVSTSRQRSASFLTKFKKKSLLTSVDFMSVWNHYDKDRNGKIEAKELDRFLKDLVNAEGNPVSQGDIKELKENLLSMFDSDNDGKISMEEMASILPTEENFLLQFGVNTKLSSVEFMKVWRHYDQDRSGQIDTIELEGFLKDILCKQGKQASIEEIQTYAMTMTEMFDSNQDGKLEIYDMLNILPVEHNFLLNFKGRSKVTREEFSEIFAHYDTDGNGVIEGDELLAFLQDLLRRENQDATFADLQVYKQCILDICDVNGDGKVEVAELAFLLSRHI